MWQFRKAGFGILAASVCLLAACGGAGDSPTPSSAQGQPVGGSLPAVLSVSTAEAKDLVFMREEEKLARDVYLALAEHWRNDADAASAVRVFDQIQASEQQHMNRLRDLLAAAGLPDPVGAAEVPGVFVDPILLQLYGDLVGRGKSSLDEALKVGALIEEKDIFDLDQAASVAQQSTILATYANLKCGSKNHLRAFALPLSPSAGSYVAQVLPQADVDAILAQASGPCGGI